MDFKYKYLYKTWTGLKIATDIEEVNTKDYNIILLKKQFREIERQLEYLDELREDVKKYLLELDTEKKKNKILKQETESLKDENIKLKKELSSKELTSIKVLDEYILEEKNDKIADLKRQLNNLSSIINSKNRKVVKLENKVAKVEKKVIKLESKSSKKVESEIEENKIIATHKSLVINRKLDIKTYKVQKNYVLDIPLSMQFEEIERYVKDIEKSKIENEEELSKYINEKGYNIWKVQTKNNAWELILLKKELKKDDKTDIEFSSQSAILKGLMLEKTYVIKKHYILPIAIESTLQEVEMYVDNAETTNIELAEQKKIYNNEDWKIQTKNNKWEVIFRAKL